MDSWGIIVSTLVAPLLAVQATRWLDRRRALTDERRRVFTTLMATRGKYLDPRHVEALNVIDVVFAGRGKALAPVRSAWRAYLNHLEPRGMPDSVWVPKRNELFVELLHAMATSFKLEFDKTTIASQALYPGGWGKAEANLQTIQEGVARIMAGSAALPVVVRQTDGPGSTATPAPGPSANVNASFAATGASPP